MLERKFKFLVTVLDTPDGEEKIVFPSYEDFYKTLTPERMEILSVLSERKVNSVSELAEILRRDYKNVWNDVKVLSASGFIKIRQEQNRKIPELLAVGFNINIDFKKGFRARSRNRRFDRDRLIYGEQLLKQKYLKISPLKEAKCHAKLNHES